MFLEAAPAAPASDIAAADSAAAVTGGGAADHVELTFGPRHPALHGVLRLRLRLAGETIVECHPLIGFGHRGLEKLFEAHSLRDGVALTDRLDFVAAAAANLAFAGAVEELLGLAVPPRARMLRVALGELQRIASHLFWLATHAAEAGADCRRLTCLRDRERVLDLLAASCGARLTVRCALPGGLPRDVPEGWPEGCGRVAAALPGWVDAYEELLTEHRGFKGRTVGLGVLSPETALDHGVSGPVLRATGIDWDLRKALPYDGYRDLDFEVPLGRNGDAYDRYRVRVAELRQSARLIAQALDGLPTGPVLSEAAEGAGPPAAAAATSSRESYFAVEGPRGEIGFYLALRALPAEPSAPVTAPAGGGAAARAADEPRRAAATADTFPWRCHVRAPSFHNLQVLPEITRGHGVGDLVVLLGSLDLALGEVDR